jgi:hypothetical protein
MTIRPLQSLVAAVLILTAASAATAGYPNACCRWMGIGGSDGYHSHYGCPPKPHAMAKQGISAPAATNASQWWMNPAADVEQLPTPAAMPPANDSSGVGQGVIRR